MLLILIKHKRLIRRFCEIYYYIFYEYIFIPDTIWDLKNDDFLETLKGDGQIIDSKIQQDLDRQIKEGLEITLLPIDLESCLKIAIENNYDIKISEQEKEESKWLYRKSF